MSTSAPLSEEDKSFCRMVIWFYQNRGDPTLFCNWDAERCQRLMPTFFKAWTDAVTAEQICRLVAIELRDSGDFGDSYWPLRML